MSGNDAKPRRKGARRLAELVGPVIDPVVAKRGFASADLIALWPEIVGPTHAAYTEPERIAWPRERDAGGEGRPGVLFLRVEGPRAIFVQHELPQIVERINAFFGYAAVGQVRIVQAPVTARASPGRTEARLAPAEEATLAARLDAVDDDRLRAALDRLGRGVLGSRPGRRDRR